MLALDLKFGCDRQYMAVSTDSVKLAIYSLNCPLPALLYLHSRVISFLHPHIGQYVTGKVSAFAAVVQSFGFTTGFHLTDPSPKRPIHIDTPFTADRILSLT